MPYQNPFLRGFQGSQDAIQRREAGQLGQLGGLLNIQNMQRQAEMDAQMKPLQLEQLKIAIARARQNQALVQQAASGSGAPAGPAPLAFGTGGVSLPGGGQGNMQTGQAIPPQQPLQRGAGGIDPRLMSWLLSGDPGLKAAAQAELDRSKPIAAREGASVINPATGEILFYAPKMEAGVGYDPAKREAFPVKNYGPAIASIEGVKTSAVEGARAGFDLVDVPDGRGGTIKMPRSQAVQRLGGGAQPGPMPGPQPIPRPAPLAAPGAMQIPPAVQGERDRQAGAMRVQESGAAGVANDIAELETALRSPGLGPTQKRILQSELNLLKGGGQLGTTPSVAELAASKKREERGVTLEGDLPQAQLQVKTQIDDIDRLISLANETMKAPSLSRSVGLIGAAPSIPGLPAANVDSLIDSLKAQVSGMKLQAMRNASKTGGAVGQVTEREWPRLENMIVVLNKKMSPEAFREKLSELVLEMKKAKESIQQAFDQEYGSVAPQRRRNDAANDPLGLRR